MSMKNLLYSIIIIVSLFSASLFSSCKTLRYNFYEQVTGERQQQFLSSTVNQVIPVSGEISGVFVEKSASYRFNASFDTGIDSLELSFFSHLDGELVFRATRIRDENTYEFYLDSFFSVKIGLMLEMFEYLVTIYPDSSDLYITTEDFYVTVDSLQNYRKYDEKYRIIKKENRVFTVKYLYSNDLTMDRIELVRNQDAYQIIVNQVLDKTLQELSGLRDSTEDVSSDS
jgi:hypothetical protein